MGIIPVNILLIDDNVSITKALSRLLTLKGHDCTISNDGRNGIQLILQKRFDVAFLDIAMPDFSGDMIIDELVKQKQISNTPIVVLTASTLSEEQTDKFMHQGVFAVLKKPIASSILYHVIDEIDKKSIPVHD